MKLKPFYFFALIFFFANLYSVLQVYFTGKMMIEAQYLSFDFSSVLMALFLWVFSFLVILLPYWFFSLLIKSEKINSYNNEKIFGFALLIYQSFFLYLAFFYKFGVANLDQSEYGVSSFIIILFNMLGPDYIFWILANQIKSNKILAINSVVYLFSSLTRGWMGGILFLLVIYMCRSVGNKINFKYIFSVLATFLVVIIISPLLFDLKFGIRGGDINFDTYNYIERIGYTLDYMIGRIQIVGHISLIMENQKFYQYLYANNLISPYYMEGNIQYLFSKYFLIDKPISFGRQVSYTEFGFYSSNTNVGLAGWFLLLKESSIIFLFYCWGLMILGYGLIVKYSNRCMLETYACLSFLLLFNGWFEVYIPLILILVLALILNKMRFTVK